MNKKKMAGVTLIELMVTIVIVSILAAVAVPSYRQYVRKANRQKGAECLMEVHRRMQVFNQNRGAYPTVLGDLQGTTSTSYACPNNETGNSASYTVTLEAYDRLTAAACGSTANYQLRGSSANASQSADGALVLGYCNNPNPNLRVIRDRELSGGVKKTWGEN